MEFTGCEQMLYSFLLIFLSALYVVQRGYIFLLIMLIYNIGMLCPKVRVRI